MTLFEKLENLFSRKICVAENFSNFHTCTCACAYENLFFLQKNLFFFFLEWLWFSFVASLCRTFAARNPTYRLSIGHCHYVVREFHFNHIVRALPDGDWYSWLFMVICGNLFFGMHFYCDLSARNQRQNPVRNCRFLCQKVQIP